jgi:hypothetical protein
MEPGTSADVKESAQVSDTTMPGIELMPVPKKRFRKAAVNNKKLRL